MQKQLRPTFSYFVGSYACYLSIILFLYLIYLHICYKYAQYMYLYALYKK